MKKLLSFIIVLTMVLSLGTAMMFNASAAWEGGVATGFTGGTGTEADPYLVSTSQELALIAKMTNEDADTCEGKYFKQINDIDLAGITWLPIGAYLNKTEIFKGHYDGDGHTVSGLKVETNGTYAGLFGRIVGATVKNLNVKGTLVSSTVAGKTVYSGGIVAYGIDGTKIINCTAEVDLVAGTTAGGVVGRMQNTDANNPWGEITACFFRGRVESVSTKNCFAGGITGVAGATVIKYCGNYGTIVGCGATTMSLAGGIMGCQGAENITCHIYNCFNLGDVSVVSTANATYAGGIVGRAAHIQDYVNAANIVSCFNANKNIVVYDESGNVMADGKMGSLVGHIRYIASISNCYVCVPTTEMSDVYLDDGACVEAGNITVITDAQMKGADAVATMKLNEAWVAGSDYPTIDVAKALTIVDAPVEEDTTPAETEPVDTPVETEPVDTPAETEPVDTPAETPTETEPVDTPDETTPDETEPSDTEPAPGGNKTFLFVAMGVVAVVAVVLIVVVAVTEKKKVK